MRVYLKVKAAQVRIKVQAIKRGYRKLVKECQKLALATLAVQVVLVWGYAYGEYNGVFDTIHNSTGTLVIDNAKAFSPEPIEPVLVVDPVEAMADYIWFKESTRGINNYSKCEAINKVNGIGYGIPGNGKYMCFNSHEEEMVALKGWIVSHKAQGLTDNQMLCLYSGSNYQECK